MTRYAADACKRGNLPGWELEFVYVDGDCAGPVAPGQHTISSLAQVVADMGDVEPGNPSWPAWVLWVVRCRAAGKDPYLYCCDDDYGDDSVWKGWRHADGVAAFQAAQVAEPHWWPFNDNRSEPPAYADICQVAQNVPPGYDVSVCNDYLPGLDPSPSPIPQEETMDPLVVTRPAGFIEAPGGQDIFTIDSTGTLYHVALSADGQTVLGKDQLAGQWQTWLEAGYDAASGQTALTQIHFLGRGTDGHLYTMGWWPDQPTGGSGTWHGPYLAAQ